MNEVAGEVPEVDDAWADQAFVSPAHLPAAVDMNGRVFERGVEVVVASHAIDAGRWPDLEFEGRGGVLVDLRPADHPTSAWVEFEEWDDFSAAGHLVALDDLVVVKKSPTGRRATKSSKSGRRRK